MKIEIEISEEKIMELAKVSSMDDLPRTIFYEASRQARDMAVIELKSKITEKSYYGSEEYLKGDVRDEIIRQISEVIKKFVAMYPEIAPEERRRIPNVLLQYVEVEK